MPAPTTVSPTTTERGIVLSPVADVFVKRDLIITLAVAPVSPGQTRVDVHKLYVLRAVLCDRAPIMEQIAESMHEPAADTASELWMRCDGSCHGLGLVRVHTWARATRSCEARA